MNARGRSATIWVVVPLATMLSGCPADETCDAVACGPVATVLVSLPASVAPGTQVTACHAFTCVSGQLPAPTQLDRTWTLSTDPIITATLSSGPAPSLQVQWWATPNAADGDGYTVTVSDPAGNAVASFAATATYMSGVRGPPCQANCHTATLTQTPVTEDAGADAGHDAGTDGGGDAGRAPVTCRPDAACPSGWFPYDDTLCSPPDQSGKKSCERVGDQLCHLACKTDADCQAVGLPGCGTLTFFSGSDAGHQVPACTGTAALPACVTASGPRL
ncbi:MAG: hypothetical protein ACJ8F1_24760 [Polyangia bacterium]